MLASLSLPSLHRVSPDVFSSSLSGFPSIISPVRISTSNVLDPETRVRNQGSYVDWELSFDECVELKLDACS